MIVFPKRRRRHRAADALRHFIAFALLAHIVLNAQTAAPTSADAHLDSTRVYTLSELIDMAERHRPETRMAWLALRRKSAETAVARAAYLPTVVGLAHAEDQRLINPFPKPLAPLGYTMVDMPEVDAGLAAEYTALDFGRRRATLAAARAEQRAAELYYQQNLQETASEVALDYIRVLTAEEAQAARQRIVADAVEIEKAAEAELAQGRATMPDVLSARAVTAQRRFDLAAAEGELTSARVALRDAVGAEAGDQLRVAPLGETKLNAALLGRIDAMVAEAQAQRKDLQESVFATKAAQARASEARANERPELTIDSRAEAQGMWPSFSQPALGDTMQFVWSVGVKLRWTFFDGGRDRAVRDARTTEAERAAEAQRKKIHEVERQVWEAYAQLRTADEQRRAAKAWLEAAQSAHSSSLEAYKYGVENLVDLLTTEGQLAQAELLRAQTEGALRASAARLARALGRATSGDAMAALLQEKQ